MSELQQGTENIQPQPRLMKINVSYAGSKAGTLFISCWKSEEAFKEEWSDMGWYRVDIFFHEVFVSE